MKLTQLGRQEHRLLAPRIEAALKDLGDEFGVDFSLNGGRLGAGKAVLKLEVGVRDTATGQSHAEMEFRSYAGYYGLSPDDFGRTFTCQGTSYKVCGVKPSAPKYPILAERVYDGAVFKFGASTVKRGLPMKAAA